MQFKPKICIICLFSALSFFPGCSKEENSLERIRSQGEITVITDNSTHGYLIYRDEPMGFEYDLAREFADFLHVDLRVITPGWNRMFPALQEKEGDLIAASLTITPGRSRALLFSNEYMTVQQQVVVKNGNRSIRSIEDLDGKTIHIRRNTSYHTRLRQLRASGIDIDIKLYDDIPTEEFLRRIHASEIGITVADSNIIRLNQRYYPDIRVALPITEEQGLGWAVRATDKHLIDSVNAFFKTIERNGTYAKIYKRYYSGTELFDYFDIKKFHERLHARLPKYKDIIVRESEKYGFDWRLIAAMIYQESHFDPMARSFADARGLMQITSRTAISLGLEDRYDPEKNIEAGTAYLNWVYNRFENVVEEDRMKVALACYNVGYGHIQDALSIAAEKGLDITRWHALKQTLPLLRNREYFADTSYGYARGTEPVRYVEQITMYYDILRNKSRDMQRYLVAEPIFQPLSSTGNDFYAPAQ